LEIEGFIHFLGPEPSRENVIHATQSSSPLPPPYAGFPVETDEGVQFTMALSYYSRLRFTLNLLPYLCQANALRRVVAVFVGDKEGPMFSDDNILCWEAIACR
jgi:hypothetical protein